MFGPDGRLVCIAMNDDEWTVAVDDELGKRPMTMSGTLAFSEDGAGIAANCRSSEGYGVILNGVPWETTFTEMRSCMISKDGSSCAGNAQLEPLAEADIEGFLKRLWTTVVNGSAWDESFLNVWGVALSDDGSSVAAEVRPNSNQQTIAVDGKPWGDSVQGGLGTDLQARDKRRRRSGTYTRGWKLLMNDKPVWNKSFLQVWHQTFSPDTNRIAAVACPQFGRWTLVVDGDLWRPTFGHVVLEPVFSPDGKRVAAVVKDEETWSMAVDGKPWSLQCEMVLESGVFTRRAKCARQSGHGRKIRDCGERQDRPQRL